MKRYKFFSEDRIFGLTGSHRADWDTYESSITQEDFDKINKLIEKNSKQGKSTIFYKSKGYGSGTHIERRVPIKSPEDLLSPYDLRDVYIDAELPTERYRVTFIEKGKLFEEKNFNTLYTGSKDECFKYLESVKDKYKGKGELGVYNIKRFQPICKIKIKKS